MTIEVVVYTIESAMHAQKGGADRIELCDNPGDGGTTPSFGTLEIVRQALSIDVYAMIRPRGGDFAYSAYEYHAMKRDIEMCKRASLDGVVLGILKPDGTIDKDRCRKLIDAARPMKVTCHRAFEKRWKIVLKSDLIAYLLLVARLRLNRVLMYLPDW